MGNSATSRRPPIPADIERLVLIEAGHRCSVCGEPCPLERAHIRPWRKSLEHSVDNLIVLCARCHQRADLEHWGEKTLRQYKEKPWILRKAADLQPKQLRRVEITLDMDLESFDICGEDLLRYALAGFLRIRPEDIIVRSIEKGSVKITVDFPSEAGEKLLKAYQSRDPELLRQLKALPVQGMKDLSVVFLVKEPPAFSIEQETIQAQVKQAYSCLEVGNHMIGFISQSPLEDVYSEAIAPSYVIRTHAVECLMCKHKLEETRHVIQRDIYTMRENEPSILTLARRTAETKLELIRIWSPGSGPGPGFAPDGPSKSRTSRSRRSGSK